MKPRTINRMATETGVVVGTIAGETLKRAHRIFEAIEAFDKRVEETIGSISMEFYKAARLLTIGMAILGPVTADSRAEYAATLEARRAEIESHNAFVTEFNASNSPTLATQQYEELEVEPTIDGQH